MISKIRIGVYSLLVPAGAVFVEGLPRSKPAFIALLVLSAFAAIWPVLSMFPAKWRGELSDSRFRRLAYVPLASLVIGTILAAYVHSDLDLRPRTGLVLGAVGLINVLSWTLLRGDQIVFPTKWSWITGLGAAGIGFMFAFVSTDISLLISIAFLYGLYGLASHFFVFLVLD